MKHFTLYLSSTVFSLALMTMPANAQLRSFPTHNRISTETELGSPMVVVQNRLATNNGKAAQQTHYRTVAPNSSLYSKKNLNENTIYSLKKGAPKRLLSKQKEIAPRDSANVTTILKYSNCQCPDVIIYNNDDGYFDTSMMEHGDTVTLRVPTGTFDIMSQAWLDDIAGGQSMVIKELVNISKDTTIVINQDDATEKTYVKCVDDKGELLYPPVWDIKWTETSQSIDTIAPGTTLGGFVRQMLYLKGCGVVYEFDHNGIGWTTYTPDETLWKPKQLCTYITNKLSDRYSFVTSAFVTRNDGEQFIVNCRRNGSSTGDVTNSVSDYGLYETDFQTTPLGEKSAKHIRGYSAIEMFNGVSLGQVDGEGPVINDTKVRLHVCAPKEYGTREDAHDIAIYPAYGDFFHEVVYKDQYEDENGQLVEYNDTVRFYNNIYGESSFVSTNGIEYFDQGHDIFGNYAFQLKEDGSDVIEYPGHAAFSTEASKRVGIYGNSSPILSFMSQSYYDEYADCKFTWWAPAYIGRLGEVRMTDNYYAKIRAEYNGEVVYDSIASASAEFCINWAQEKHDDGIWKLTLTDDNVSVDGIAGKNIAKISYDQRLEDGTAPTLQMLTFKTNEGVVTDRFAKSDEGVLEFAGGDFNFKTNDEHSWFDCQPMTVKVEYAPYGTNTWNEIAVKEVPELYTAPAFGYFYRGSLSSVKGGSRNGWFDLRLTLTDLAGNVQEQTISPAFKVDALTAIQLINTTTESSDKRIYDLSGRVVNHPTKGIYVKGNKKYVIK